MSDREYILASRELFALLDREYRFAKRRGDFVYAQLMNRARLTVSSRIALLERAEKRAAPEQLQMLTGRSGRRHDDGDAA